MRIILIIFVDFIESSKFNAVVVVLSFVFIRVYVNIYVLLQFISMEAENIKNELACRV